MPILLSDAIRRVRSLVEEPQSRFWTDTEITDWINDACRDINRRTEDLLTFDTSVTVTAGVAKYAMPSDVLRVHRMEWVPTANNTLAYPIMLKTYMEMDQVWGINQSSPSSYPSFAVLWGYPGGTSRNLFQVQLYPVPSSGGTLNVYYYRLPYRFLDPIANPGELNKNCDVLEGYDDLIIQYAKAMAQMKDRDPQWQDSMKLYERILQDMTDNTRRFHDQAAMIQTGSGSMQPAWLYGGDEW